MRGSTHTLRDDIDFKEGDGKHRYILPFDEDDAYSAFDALNRAFWSLKPIAEKTEDDDYDSAFVYAHRRFGRIFKLAYDYPSEASEKHVTRMPTVKDIHSDFYWHDGIPARTITLEKTENQLFLAYEDGFHATDEVVDIEKETEDSLLARGIRGCGQGMKHEHAPYNPSITNRWRYNPSKVRVSIESNNGTVRLGICNEPPKEPLWYRGYKHLSTLSKPYAHTTFDMDSQTSVVKFTYNQNQPEEDHI